MRIKGIIKKKTKGKYPFGKFAWLFLVIIISVPIVQAVGEPFSETIVIHAIFSPPDTQLSIEPIGPQFVYEGQSLSIPIIVDAPLGIVLKYTVGPLPEGADFDDKGLAIVWNPTFYQAGVYVIGITVTDGVNTVYEEVTITVLDPLPTFIPNPQIIIGAGTQQVKIGEILDPDSFFTSCEVPIEHQDICSVCYIDEDGGIYLTCTPPSGGQGTTETIPITITDPLHGIIHPVDIPINIKPPVTPAPPVPPAPRLTEREGVLIPGAPSFMLPSGELIPRTGTLDLGNGNYLLIVYDEDGKIVAQYVITAEMHIVHKKYGKTSAYFRFEKGNCKNLTKIKTEILEEFDIEVQEKIKKRVEEENLEVREIPFIVDVSIEPPCTTGNSSLFLTVNATWVYEQAGWDVAQCALIPTNTPVPNIGIVHISDNLDGTTTSDYLTVVTNASACPSEENTIKLRVDADHLSIYGMVSVKAKETAGVTTAANPNVEPMLVPSGTGTLAFITENPVVIAGVVAFLVIIGILEAKFHVLRRKEHKHLEHPEGGPPAWEGLIETDRQKALSAIIDVLNNVDAQLKDLNRTMAKRAPGFVFATAEADAIVEKFFYTCQVAEEKIKTAAAEEHITQKQVDHLNGQLKDAVDRMIAASQKSEVLAQAVQAHIGTGSVSAGGD
jgi:hypothetical protein